VKNLVWSTSFVRKFKRLIKKNPPLRSQVENILQLLTEDPFDSSLRTHKLKGDLDGVWSCSIDYDNLILFEFVTNPDSGEEYFKPLEYRYDQKDGKERIELIIPQSLFSVLNKFPRVLKLM
jgi:mRNA-degrading endonuclease YafQ of YafQ-DinJ toxin-antitoxin module